MRAQPKRSDFLPWRPMANKSTSGALAKGTRNSSPEELDEDDAPTERALDDNDSLLSVLNYLNGNIYRMASSMTAMGESLVPFSQQSLREV